MSELDALEKRSSKVLKRKLEKQAKKDAKKTSKKSAAAPLPTVAEEEARGGDEAAAKGAGKGADAVSINTDKNSTGFQVECKNATYLIVLLV